MKNITGVLILFILSHFLSSYIVVASPNILSIAKFSSLKEGTLPSEWEIKEWKGKADIQVVKDNTTYALRMRSMNTLVAIHKKISLDIKDYPMLNWQWKVTKMPVGGDVRKKDTNDQAGQIYVIFPKFPSQINSRMVGYIWDTNAPVGIDVTSQKRSTVKYIVVESGANNLGKWLIEKRNVYNDYKRLFNEEPPMVGSIALMIDSDNTKTNSEGFFGDIYLSKE